MATRLTEIFADMVLETRPGQQQRRRRDRSNAPSPPRRRQSSAGNTPIERGHFAPRPQEEQRRGRTNAFQPPRRRNPGVSPPPIRRAPSAPRAPSSQEAVYFREGSGYLFVKTLGNGVDGSATLVRSVVNGKLYVRKEDFHWLEMPHDTNFPRTRPEETANALSVRHIDGVYRAHGWTRWVDSHAPISFNVTYWRYSDLGALAVVIQASREMERPIPEAWGAIWMVSMIDTVINVHNAGIVHNDPHQGNWLLESTEAGVPRIILADFGRSQTKSELSKWQWKNRCTDDFELVLATICSVLNLQYDTVARSVVSRQNSRVSPFLIAKLDAFARIATRNWDSVGALHEAVSNASEEIFQMYRRSNRITHPATEPRQITYPFKTGEGLIDAVRQKPAGFKQWRKAQVTGSRIETRSTGYCDQFVQHVGEWYERMGEANPVWHVDRAR